MYVFLNNLSINGDRLQTLLDKKKADTLTATEKPELEAIAETDKIFSYVNGAIAMQYLKTY